MVKSKQVLPTLAVAAVAAVAVAIWLPSETKRIKKQFQRMSNCIASSKGESLIKTGLRVDAMAGLLANPCKLKSSIPGLHGTYSAREAAGIISMLTSQLEGTSLEFHDLGIKIVDKDSAIATVTARLTGRADGGQNVSEVRELECSMARVDGKWLFQSCAIIDVLQK